MAKMPKNQQDETFTIMVEDKQCVLTKPSRKIIGQALQMVMPGIGSGDVLQAGEWIINTCWISGDTEIKNEDDYLIPACMKALELIKFKEATLKKN